MEYYLFVFTITFLVGFESSWTSSIPYKRPCRDLSPECLKNSIQSIIPLLAKGAPELGLEPLDPYDIYHLNLTLSGITIHFSRGYARGLRTCIVDFARYTGDTFEIQVHCNLTIRGKYRSSGSLSVFPIDGDGISVIKCDNLKLYTILKLGSKEVNGQKYIEIKSSTTKHAYDGRVSYAMTNLFKESPEMSKAVVQFMNNNWLLVAEQFGTPIVDFGVKSVMKSVRQLLNVLSIEELEKL